MANDNTKENKPKVPSKVMYDYINNNYNETFKRIVEKTKDLSLSEMFVISTIINYQRLRVKDYETLFNISKGRIGRVLIELKNKGILETYKKEGNEKEVYYILKNVSNS